LCCLAAFPSSSLVYIANLALLTTTLHRPVPALTLSASETLAQARQIARPLCYTCTPLPLRPRPAGASVILRRTCTRFCARLHPALSRESPARIARGPRSPTALTTHPGAIESASQHSSPTTGRGPLRAGIRPDEGDRSARSALADRAGRVAVQVKLFPLDSSTGRLFIEAPIARCARPHHRPPAQDRSGGPPASSLTVAEQAHVNPRPTTRRPQVPGSCQAASTPFRWHLRYAVSALVPLAAHIDSSHPAARLNLSGRP
jgi:hypothetical protein